MPQTVDIAIIVLSGILILIGILGGKFKLFGAEIAEKIEHRPVRALALILGLMLIIVAKNYDLLTPLRYVFPKNVPGLPSPTVPPIEHAISGVITANNGKPLEQVTVEVLETRAKTTSNEKGEYKIAVSSNISTVNVSFSKAGFNPAQLLHLQAPNNKANIMMEVEK